MKDMLLRREKKRTSHVQLKNTLLLKLWWETTQRLVYSTIWCLHTTFSDSYIALYVTHW